MARNKMRISAEDASDQGDNWIWGNNRGGGGAPLKDNTGAAVTNLRQVFRGSVDVDYSPSHSKNDQRRFDDGYADRDRDEVGYRDRQRRAHNERDGRDRDSDHYSDRSVEKVGQRRHGDYSPDDRRSNRNGGSKPRGIPGLDDLPAVQSHGTLADSPKKFLGALREMNSGATSSEREMKLRKEMSYQQALREQIEENRRKKEEEKRQMDEIKRKEYDDFLLSQGKAPRSQVSDREQYRGRNGRVDASAERSDDGPYRDRGGDRDGDGWKRRNEFEREAEKPGAFRRRVDRQDCSDERMSIESYPRDRDKRGRNDVRASVNDQEDSYTDGSISRRRDKGYDGRGERGKGRDGGAGWVEQDKYDELQSLCDRLMQQQEELQQEIRHQASLIQDLQVASSSSGKGGGKNSERSAAPGQLRSKSVQQRRALASGNKANNANVAANARGVNDVDRPSSMYARPTAMPGQQQPKDFGLPRKGARAPPPKVAFGGAVGTAAAAGSKAAVGGVLAKAGRDAMGAGARAGAKDNRSAAPPNRASAAELRAGREDRRKAAPARSVSPAGRGTMQRREGVGGGDEGGPALGGFAKLQAAVVKGGPMIVSYEDDEMVGVTGAGRSKDVRTGAGAGERRGAKAPTAAGRGRLNSASELNGESEYFAVAGEGRSDGINNDELDRLLVQARRVRAGF